MDDLYSPTTHADEYRDPHATIAAILHLRAPNDANGNPRRVFVALTDSGTVAAIADEGYNGPPDWTRNRLGYPYPFAVDVPPAEYRRVLRQLEDKRGAFAVVDEEGDVWRRRWTRASANRARAELAPVFDRRTFTVRDDRPGVTR